MIWAMDLDDFSGAACGQGPYPLMHAIKNECDKAGGSSYVPPTRAPTPSPPQGQATTQAPSQTQSPGEHHEIQHTDDFHCGGKTDGFYAHPSCCEFYYLCASGVAYRVQCATNLVFNANSHFCDTTDKYTCPLRHCLSSSSSQ